MVYLQCCFGYWLCVLTVQEIVSAIDDATFTAHCHALATRRLDKPKNFIEKTKEYWTEITTGFYHFERGMYVQMDARSVILYSCFMLRTVIVLMSSIIIVEQRCSSYVHICIIVWWWLPVCHIRIYNTHQKFLYLRVHLVSTVTLPRLSIAS